MAVCARWPTAPQVGAKELGEHNSQACMCVVDKCVVSRRRAGDSCSVPWCQSVSHEVAFVYICCGCSVEVAKSMEE